METESWKLLRTKSHNDSWGKESWISYILNSNVHKMLSGIISLEVYFQVISFNVTVSQVVRVAVDILIYQLKQLISLKNVL